jgi:HAD superfamily hydrolase (TIGR01509 family)
MKRILDENNIKYGEDLIKTITPLGCIGTANYFISLGINKTIDELIDLMKEYFMEDYLYNIPAKEGVIETLKELKRQGSNLNILTASPHITLDPCLKRLGIYDLFNNVWSCDDFNTTKANPEIYKMVAARIGKPINDIIFIDDNLNAVKTAKQAGMISYGIYDSSSEDYVDEIKKIADCYLSNLGDLL